MTIVLNEIKQAEKIIKEGEVGNKPSSTLFLLSRYFRQRKGCSKTETISELNSFMQNNYKNYNPVLWEDIIENIAQKSLKYPLRSIDSIGITQYELDILNNIHNLKYEKLVFTMLCHAKLYNIISENNNGWVNTDIPEIYRLSRVTVKHREDKFLYLNDLESNYILGDKGVISFSNKNDNLNIKVNFVDMEGESVLNITDFRELGYEYMRICNIGNFVECCQCFKLIRKKNKKDYSTKYCPNCAYKMKLIQVNNSKKRTRNKS